MGTKGAVGGEPPPRSALVTGATGFVGSHLAKRLVRDGWSVHAVVRAASELPESDEMARVHRYLCDGRVESVIDAVAAAKPDVVFHLASLFIAQHQAADVDRLVESNILFGSQLLEAMAQARVACLVNAGTSWQHFHGPDYDPVNLYAATKQAVTDIIRYYVDACGIRCITLKLFDTYGPDDRRRKLLSLLIQAARTGEPLALSPGEQVMDLIFVEDVVEAFLVASGMLLDGCEPAYQDFAVSGGQRVSLRELVKLCEEIMGARIPVNWGARAYRPREVMVPEWFADGLPGWRPRYSLREGLSRVLLPGAA